jgi:large subunit ribosomal protein L5
MIGNPMRQVRLEKITLNIGAGEAGPNLEKGKVLLKKISGCKIVVTNTHKRTTFGGAKGRPIGAKVTIRGEPARELLGRLLQGIDNKLKPSQFDRQGNVSFGIVEYIHIQGMKYDPDIGIMGFDVCVTLKRPGFRISKKRIRPGRIGSSHRITPEDAQKWIQDNFQTRITEEVESRFVW